MNPRHSARAFIRRFTYMRQSIDPFAVPFAELDCQCRACGCFMTIFIGAGKITNAAVKRINNVPTHIGNGATTCGGSVRVFGGAS